jgi:hypothetical protein
MVEVTAVPLKRRSRAHRIGQMEEPRNRQHGENTRQTMVEWERNQGGRAYVSYGTRAVEVGVVNDTPPYIGTYADGVWTDNLLALPRY